MTDYTASTYGDRIAEIYDRWLEGMALDTEGAVEFLAGLAGRGPALELAVGTGRMALPLRARGIDVRGIDASAAMVGKLREKPGGAAIPVTMGDFADVGVEGPFRLIFVVFNTFFALLTQDDQVRCFRNVAARLAPDGVFALEAFVPDLGRFDRGQRLETSRVETDHVSFEATHHDPVLQRVTSHHVVLSDAGVKLYPVRLRYAWPAELDLMAQLAGLALRERWGGWRGEAFTAASGGHVSVYHRPADR